MNGLGERLLVGGGLALVAALFAWLNGHAHVDVNLGIVRFDRVPLPLVVFSSVLVGMLTLFLASLKAEQRTDRMLRRYREALGRRSEAGGPRDPRGETRPPDAAADEA